MAEVMAKLSARMEIPRPVARGPLSVDTAIELPQKSK
jgi:hypothetical protein